MIIPEEKEKMEAKRLRFPRLVLGPAEPPLPGGPVLHPHSLPQAYDRARSECRRIQASLLTGLQSSPTLCNPVDCRPSGSSVHGVLEARTLQAVGCHALLQGIFPTQGMNLRLLCFLHWQAVSLPMSHLGSLVSLTKCKYNIGNIF